MSPCQPFTPCEYLLTVASVKINSISKWFGITGLSAHYRRGCGGSDSNRESPPYEGGELPFLYPAILSGSLRSLTTRLPFDFGEIGLTDNSPSDYPHFGVSYAFSS